MADIAKAKSEIFDGMNGGIAILPRDDAHFALLAERAKAQSLKIISFGTSEEADYQLVSQHPSDEGQRASDYIRDHWQDGRDKARAICATSCHNSDDPYGCA